MLPGKMRITDHLRRAEVLVLAPVLIVALHWVLGEWVLLTLSAGVPVLGLLLLRLWPAPAPRAVSEQVIDRLDAVLHDRAQGPGQAGCLVLQFDDPSRLCDQHGRCRQSAILAACVARLRGALRPGDLLFPLEDGSLAVVLGHAGRLDADGLLRIAGRLQLVAQQPLVLPDATVQVTCSIGLCHSGQLVTRTGRALLEAAQIATDEAMRHRPGAIRAFSEDLARVRADRDQLRAGFAAAVEAGQIRAHFQPQLSTDTGQVSGLEALARWHHPDRGCLAPAAFLPALEGTDLMPRLAQEMLSQSLAVMVALDRAGLRVPTVAVNLSPQDLRDPHLPERLAWALDGHGLAPARLTVEVLETVVAGVPDDIIARNIARIAALGCGVDLDDFGTGNASITTLRHFSARRLKIDRSFVRGVDHLRDQQRMVTAILSLADQLGLETLGEGVETQAEHAMLAQLGCGHVQGYGIAHPMPFDDLSPWLLQHAARLARATRLVLRAGQGG